MSYTTKRVLKIMLILEIIVLGVGMVFTKYPLYYALGVVLGTAVSSMQLILMEKTFNRSVDMSPADAQNYARLHYMLRMAVVAVIVVIAIKVRFIDILGFVLGILPMAPAVYIHGLIFKEKDNDSDGEKTR